MITHIECFPCFLKQTLIALRQCGVSEEAGERIVRDVLLVLRDADTAKPPSHTSTSVHRLIRERLGRDPFERVKREYNNVALGLYPRLREMAAKSEDPLGTAARLAIAGNIIDFGIFTSVDIEGSIKRALGDEFDADCRSFRGSVSEAATVLYLLDNSGEIVFDRLLIEELVARGKKVTAVVKGSAVLNDVTMEDAQQTGLTGICEVIDNGSDAVGTVLEWTSRGFRRRFGEADMIISKGQGNFETLLGKKEKIHFLFQSKCEVVSRELGLPPGSMVLKRF